MFLLGTYISLLLTNKQSITLVPYFTDCAKDRVANWVIVCWYIHSMTHSKFPYFKTE